MSIWVASTLRTPKAQHHAIASQVPVTVRLREDPKGSKWRIDELGIPQSGMMHDSTVVGRGLGLYAQYKLESLYTFSSTMPMQSSHYRCIVQTFRILDGYTISLLRLSEKHGRLLYARPLHVEASTSMPRALPGAVASPLFRLSVESER